MTNQITITLPATFEVASRGKTLTVDCTALAPDLFARAALHGIKQKIADAAAGAAIASFRDKAEGESAEAYKAAFDAFKVDPKNADAIAEKGFALMQKVYDNLLAGDWGTERGAGSAGLSALEVEMAKAFIAGAKLTFDKGVKTADRYAKALADLATRPAATQDKVKAYAQKQLDMAKAVADLGL